MKEDLFEREMSPKAQTINTDSIDRRPCFAATRGAALALFRDFLPRAGTHYAQFRNRDLGPENRSNVSQLSPAIRRRLITESEITRAVCAHHGFQKSEKFIQEIFWRTYWKGWLEARPAIWHRYRDSLATLTDKWRSNAHYCAAISGSTGIECFDFWVRELEQTGYLHNHARMWFASIWIFTLELPWELGADFFYHHLLDADPASNTLSWRWVAGLQTVGKNYVARASNIHENTNGRFNPAGQLNEYPAPLVPDAIPAALSLSILQLPDFNKPTGLFITTEDLHLESLVPDLLKIDAIVAITSIGGAPSPGKRQYVENALNDGLSRASVHFCADVERYSEEQLHSEMKAWAVRHNLQQVVTAFAPVGPVADLLDKIENSLRESNIKLIRLQRKWDLQAWPHTKKGFFNLKQNLGTLIASV
jgi:deoxyribodipyrimidine photo-lyase